MGFHMWEWSSTRAIAKAHAGSVFYSCFIQKEGGCMAVGARKIRFANKVRLAVRIGTVALGGFRTQAPNT
jgi:hypothetical protein